MAGLPLRTLVLGGARSGKSRHAEQLAARLAAGGPVHYFATAAVDPADTDFAARVAVHRERRPAAWETIEGATNDLVRALSGDQVILVDDIGGWLTARIDARNGWEGPRGVVAADVTALLEALRGCAGPVVLVSPEVGAGVVPATAAGRLFRDELGELNQSLARACDRVVFVAAGLPVYLKGAATGGSLLNRPTPARQSGPKLVKSVPAAAPAAAADGPVTFSPVPAPDGAVLAAAGARQAQLTKPAGSLGRLESLGNWLSACQGVCPPKQFERVRAVVFAGDHGIAAKGVSAFPSEVTQQMVANFLAGGAAVNALADAAGATVRVADIAVDGDTDPVVAQHKVRRGSGAIDTVDALTLDEVHAALRAGRTIADEEVDAGADLLIAGDMGIGNTTPATVLIAALTNTEPVAVIGRGTGIDDAAWIRKTAAVRDALRRARAVVHDPVELVRVAGGADFAAMAGFLAQAAARRTPVILDGVVVTAAALLAEDLAAGAREWWVAGHRSVEPAHQVALEQLRLEPLLDYGMRLGEGSGALTALPILRAAVATLANMATFADAGVSGKQ